MVRRDTVLQIMAIILIPSILDNTSAGPVLPAASGQAHGLAVILRGQPQPLPYGLVVVMAMDIGRFNEVLALRSTSSDNTANEHGRNGHSTKTLN